MPVLVLTGQKTAGTHMYILHQAAAHTNGDCAQTHSVYIWIYSKGQKKDAGCRGLVYGVNLKEFH